MRAAAAAALIALGWGRTASAQPAQPPGPPPPPPPSERASVLLGVGIGPGSFAVQVGSEEPEEYDESFGYELRFGGMITPRLALGVELFGLSQNTDDGDGELTVYQRNIGAWIRWWVMRRLWLQGGLHSARLGANGDFDDVQYPGVGVSAAVGFEIFHRRSWSLDAALRLSGSGFSDDALSEDIQTNSIALAVAFNWFF